MVQNIKIVTLAKIWYQDQLKYAEFNGDVHFYSFRLEIHFLDKIGPKNQNCQFKPKFDT